jgi:hypothetical protein
VVAVKCARPSLARRDPAGEQPQGLLIIYPPEASAIRPLMASISRGAVALGDRIECALAR